MPPPKREAWAEALPQLVRVQGAQQVPATPSQAVPRQAAPLQAQPLQPALS
jgi:hypothetical protein